MIIKVPVPPEGNEIWIDKDRNQIGSKYPNWHDVWLWHPISDFQQFLVCRFCGKPLSDEQFARAYRFFTQQTCSIECSQAERLKRYACCDKAKPYGCMCEFAITCPEHGIRHFGSHD